MLYFQCGNHGKNKGVLIHLQELLPTFSNQITIATNCSTVANASPFGSSAPNILAIVRAPNGNQASVAEYYQHTIC